MITIELFVSRPTGREQELAEHLLSTIYRDGGAPDSTIASARALGHVIVHKPIAWATGGSDAPRYLVRLTVPGAWADRDFAGTMISMVTNAVADFVDDPERLTQEPHCVVQVVALRDHHVGVLGGPVTSDDITRMITESFRDSDERPEPPAGSVIDPTCGMTVELATAKYTLDHDGTTYAFCAPGCRRVFAEDNRISA